MGYICKMDPWWYTTNTTFSSLSLPDILAGTSVIGNEQLLSRHHGLRKVSALTILMARIRNLGATIVQLIHHQRGYFPASVAKIPLQTSDTHVLRFPLKPPRMP